METRQYRLFAVQSAVARLRRELYAWVDRLGDFSSHFGEARASGVSPVRGYLTWNLSLNRRLSTGTRTAILGESRREYGFWGRTDSGVIDLFWICASGLDEFADPELAALPE